MEKFDLQLFFKAIYEASETDLINYIKENEADIPVNKKEQLISTVVQRKKWEVFKYCIDNGLIETELFEYNSFDDRPLSSVLTGFKMIAPNDLEIQLSNFVYFLEHLEDINEELAGDNLLSYLIKEGYSIPIIKAVIDQGIKLNFINKAEQNYLHLACSQRKNNQTGYGQSLIELLLENGIELNKADIEGRTPLFLALDNYLLSKTDPIRFLLDQGADPMHLDKNGQSPIYVAAVHLHNADLTALLLTYGTPDFDYINKFGENLLNAFLRVMMNSEGDLNILGALLQNGADLKATSKYYDKDKSGIDWVAEKPSEVLKYLLDNNFISVNDPDNNNQTLLIKVCQVNPNYEEAKAKDLYKKVRYLLKAGADAQIEDRFDKKAIDYAMGDNLKSKIVDFLTQNN